MPRHLWQKLFLAFVALSMSALLALYFLQQRAFQRDFLEYVNRIGIDRLERAAERIATRYEEIGNWSFLIRRPRAFENFLSGVEAIDARAPGMEDEAQRGPPPQRPERVERDVRPGPPPNREAGGPLRGSPDDRRGPPEDRTEPRGPPDARPFGSPGKRLEDGSRDPMPFERAPPKHRVDALNFQTRVALLAANGELVIGNPAVPRDSQSIPIMSKGKAVGRLLFAQLPALESDADVAFSRSQARHTLIAMAFVLSGALLLAWLLARWLLAPIKALTKGSQQLASGDYTTRIEINRRDELAELASEFNQLAATLERNQQARRDWGADIAHELRTPLAILRGEIQALQDGVRPLGQESLASLQAECARLTALVEDLYQLALSDAGALAYRMDKLDLGAVLSDVADDHRQLMQNAGITLKLDTLPTGMHIRGDELRLMQLFGNVLTNACRYTDAPGRVEIQVKHERDAWLILIDDTPPGVDSELRPRLFERLFRVETSRNRAAGGAGLGLAICKNIAEAHGGTIQADASPLGGLRICIRLPDLATRT